MSKPSSGDPNHDFPFNVKGNIKLVIDKVRIWIRLSTMNGSQYKNSCANCVYMCVFMCG